MWGIKGKKKTSKLTKKHFPVTSFSLTKTIVKTPYKILPRWKGTGYVSRKGKRISNISSSTLDTVNKNNPAELVVTKLSITWLELLSVCHWKRINSH